MNKSVCSKQINKESLILQFPKNNDPYKVLQPAPTKADKNYIIDYKNISLSLTGEMSSASIHRNSLTQERHDISFTDTAEEEEDDEQFILDMKKKIDQNCKPWNNENYNIRDLQSKSYSMKKRKCVLSDEDQNLIKRFKRSVNESKAIQVTPQKLQSRNVTFDHDMIMTKTPQMIMPAVSFNNINTNFGSDTNGAFFHETSTTQKNDPHRKMTSENARNFVIETEIEQLVYCEMQCFTPPEKNN